MIGVSPRAHRTLTALHGWAGVILGLLVLIILTTGAIATVSEEIGQWSSGALEAGSPFARSLDAPVRRLLAAAPAGSRDTISLMPSASNRLRIERLSRGGGVVAYDIAGDGRTLARFDDGRDPAAALAVFVVATHKGLHTPLPLGLLINGVAGLTLLLLAVSGLVIHRQLLLNAFLLRRSANPVLERRDVHSVAGTWALPFLFIIAFTGSIFAFSAAVGFPLIAVAAFGGDQGKVFSRLIVTVPPAAGNPAPVRGADLDRVVADAMARTRSTPLLVTLSHPGRADARINVFQAPRPGRLSASFLVYDGVDGRLLQEHPPLGRVSSLGGQVFEPLAQLHVGNFAGRLSKIAWAAMGVAAAVTTASGLRFWLARRDLTRPVWSLLDRATTIVAYGLPLATGTAAAGFFITLADGATATGTAVGFLAGLGAALIKGLVGPRLVCRRILAVSTAVVFIALPGLRLVTGGPGWAQAFSAGQPIIAVGDIAVALIGVAFMVKALQPQRQPAPRARRVAAPAVSG